MIRRKGYDAKRRAIAEAAWRLFAARGYDDASVNAVIAAAGISKGTFYHYFSSKEEVLDAVVNLISEQGNAAVEKACRDDTIPAVERLNRFLHASRVWRLVNLDALVEITRALYHPENALLLVKMREQTRERTIPFLAAVIAQGVREGVFDVSDPAEAAVLVIQMAQAPSEGTLVPLTEQGPPSAEEIVRRANFYLEMLERLLGAPPRSIQRTSFQAVATVMNGLELTAPPVI